MSDQQPAKVLRLPTVIQRTGLSRSTIYRLEAEGKFPKHIKLTERAAGWLEHEVNAFIAARTSAARRPGEQAAA
jgi:prophage regulatory protein